MAMEESIYHGTWKVIYFSVFNNKEYIDAFQNVIEYWLKFYLFSFQIVECVSLAGVVETTGIEG